MLRATRFEVMSGKAELQVEEDHREPLKLAETHTSDLFERSSYTDRLGSFDSLNTVSRQ